MIGISRKLLVNDALRILGRGYEPIVFAQLGLLNRVRPTRLGRGVPAQRYLRGHGIEIGPMGSRSFHPLGTTIKYVDRVPAAYFRDPKRADEYKYVRLTDPDIIDDAQFLEKIEDDQVDFLIAFHVLEHLPRTLCALENWLRVVRSGGYLLIAIPDKRHTRDHLREITPIDHFVRDYREGPEWSEDAHYRDVALNVLKLTTEEEIAEFKRETPGPHFHVWDLRAFIKFIDMAQDFFENKFDLIEIGLNQREVICVLRVH